MLTQTRRPPSEEEFVPHRLELGAANSKLKTARDWEKRGVPILLITCIILAVLAVVGYQIVSVELLAGSLSILPVALYFLVTNIFTNPEGRSSILEAQQKELQALIDRGSFVETRVTSSRCFVILPFDDESAEYYFDLGEQGTVVIYEFEMDGVWTPNTDFTLSYLETPSGIRFDESVRGVGQRLEPMAEISRSDFTVPEFDHLQVIPGSFEERLQRALQQAEA